MGYHFNLFVKRIKRTDAGLADADILMGPSYKHEIAKAGTQGQVRGMIPWKI